LDLDRKQNLIFVVDDDFASRELLTHQLEEAGFIVESFESGKACWAALSQKPSVICLDMFMPGWDGPRTLTEIKKSDPDIPVIMVTNDDAVDSIVGTMRAGAYDYVVKPFDKLRLQTILDKAIEQNGLTGKIRFLQTELKNTYTFQNIIGQSTSIQKLFSQLNKIEDTNINIFINGETGTGKELVARAIHYSGSRAKGPFIAINCGAIPENLQESELFGYEKGAFTGAGKTKKGKCELADGGSIFFDEIADLSLATQVKLLRFIQEKVLERLGGVEEISVNVRVISATNQDLKKKVEEGLFREDLYYRLVVYPVVVPPLRERMEDIPLLCTHFIKKYQGEIKKTIRSVKTDAMELLVRYSWPGNVRQLENVVYRAMICADNESIDLSCLPEEILEQSKELTEWITVPKGEEGLEPASGKLQELDPQTTRLVTLDEAEKKAIQSALHVTQGNVPLAAKQLGVSRATFYRKMKKHELNHLEKPESA